VSKHIEEYKDAERRKKNNVIYKVPEVNADNAEDRKDDDLTFVTELFKSVFKLEHDNINEKNIQTRESQDSQHGRDTPC